MQQGVVIELTNLLLNSVAIYSAEVRNGIKKAKANGDEWNDLEHHERSKIIEKVALGVSAIQDPNVKRYSVFVQSLIRDTLQQICNMDEEEVMKFVSTVVSSYTWMIIDRLRQRFVNVHLANNSKEVNDFRKRLTECFGKLRVFQPHQSQDKVILAELCSMSAYGFVANESNVVFSEKKFTFYLRDLAFKGICHELQSLLCNGKENSNEFCRPISYLTFEKPY